jgi:hypothetical protein
MIKHMCLRSYGGKDITTANQDLHYGSEVWISDDEDGKVIYILVGFDK